MTTDTTAHAVYSASGSERWLRCAGSIELSFRAPPQKDSVYALEGTQAHSCLEQFLKNPPEKKAQVKAMLLASNPIEMVQHTLAAAETIWDRVPPGAELLAETKCDLSFVAPGMFGTADAVIVEDFGLLQVFDLKYGAGIAVEVDDNSQLAYYALGVAHKYDYNFSRVSMVVIQPRAEHFSGNTTREWVITMDELVAWTKTFKDGVAACEDLLAPLNPGKWCRFCPAKPICPSVGDLALKQAQVEFAPIDMLKGGAVVALPALPAPGALKNLGHVLTACDLLETWIEGVRLHAIHQLESGHQVEGFKLVAKLARRTWKDPAKAERDAIKLYGQDVYTEPELLSPAQLEKKFKCKDWVTLYTDRQSTGTTMVPESDKRPAVDQLRRDFADPATVAIPDVIDVVATEMKVKPLPKIVANARSKATAAPKRAAKEKAKAKVKAKTRKR